MSAEQGKSAASNPVGAAQLHVFNNVHRPVFLAKLASLGHAPQTEEEVQAALELGFKLAALARAEKPAAHAAPQQNKFAAANASVDRLLHGSASLHDLEIKQAAQQLLQDPDVYAATVLITSAQAAA